jgi:3-phenylpropionate/trans-cinnamate dioxygenase ferredoxin reductase subunit
VSDGVVIVGGGQGGFQLAASLREAGYAEKITLVGEEPGLPYQRPPLSKAYLKGEADAEHLELRPAAFYADHRVDLVTARVEAIDRAVRRVTLSDGLSLPYDHLVLATGARNRPLPVPGADLDGVLYLRTLADADDLKARLAGARHVVVVGAGFIGLEFAAAARALGHEVTVLEATQHAMGRAISPAMSAFFADAHRAMGTRLVLSAGVVWIHGNNERVARVETTDGAMQPSGGVLHPADLVLVGIGVVPNAELALAAGLDVANGIVVDAELRTSDPNISALGDAVSYPSRHAGGMARLESVQNAVDHARTIAARLTGRPAAYAAVPWFWSDQSDLKLQMVGLARPTDDAVLRGDPLSRRFSVFRFRDGRLTAIESVNRPADHMLGRRLLADPAKPSSLTPEQAADEGVELKALLGK